MINLALIPLEKEINRALKTDPDTIKRLNTLSDKVIKLEVTDWNLALFVMPHLNRIELQANYSKSPNTTIRGKLNDLMRISIAKDKQAAIQQHRIEFQGDADVGMTLQRVLSHLDIHWEDYISDIVGNTPGQFIAKTLQKTAAFSKQVFDSLTNNTKEYIFHEKQIFPSEKELKNFYQDVAVLRDDVERLAARIQHLKGKHN